jgi:4a-hydroxytetrahydrobiopterin dehydratase
MEALSRTAINQALETYPAWRYDEGRRAFYRRIVLKDFSAAFGLMAEIALAAEKADHHPEWFNVYNRIDIWLTTHDANGASRRDVEMMATIDRLADSRLTASTA